MALYSEITADIDAAERGSQVGAFSILMARSFTAFRQQFLSANNCVPVLLIWKSSQSSLAGSLLLASARWILHQCLR